MSKYHLQPHKARVSYPRQHPGHFEVISRSNTPEVQNPCLQTFPIERLVKVTSRAHNLNRLPVLLTYQWNITDLSLRNPGDSGQLCLRPNASTLH